MEVKHELGAFQTWPQVERSFGACNITYGCMDMMVWDDCGEMLGLMNNNAREEAHCDAAG